MQYTKFEYWMLIIIQAIYTGVLVFVMLQLGAITEKLSIICLK